MGAPEERREGDLPGGEVTSPGASGGAGATSSGEPPPRSTDEITGEGEPEARRHEFDEDAPDRHHRDGPTGAGGASGSGIS